MDNPARPPTRDNSASSTTAPPSYTVFKASANAPTSLEWKPIRRSADEIQWVQVNYQNAVSLSQAIGDEKSAEYRHVESISQRAAISETQHRRFA